MRIDAFCALDFDARLEREAMVQIGDAMAPWFDADVSRARTGLIVVSDNAGSATSVQFWSDAVRMGVGVASPELFPWCLANAPCGALARRFHITGPNATLLGESDALLAALDTAADQLAEGRVDVAVIVALSFAHARSHGKGLALHVCGDSSRARLDLGALRAASACSTLRVGLDALLRQLSADCCS